MWSFLGGILALDFVKEYPEKINSIILIGVPYKIPKTLFKMQSLIFHIMPKSTFKEMGCSKREFKIISNSSHEVNIDNPEELSYIIYDFWKDKE